MKKTLVIACLLQAFSAQATWLLVTIDNQSDLQSMQAARNNDVEIQSISKKIQNPQDSGLIHIGQESLFGAVGTCKIIAQDPDGNKVSILFLGDPTNRVAMGRAPYADFACRNAAHLHNESMMARVMLEANGVRKLIGFYTGYQDENQKFALELHGLRGNYTAVLKPAFNDYCN